MVREDNPCQSAAAGRRTVKTEPFPGSLVTVTSPPIMRASLRVMASPETGAAEPLRGRGIGLGELLEQLRLLLGRHADAGVGDGQAQSSRRRSLTLRARSVTSPSLVNLQALLNRLSRICRSRMGSTVSVPRLSWQLQPSRRFLFCSASCRAVPITSSISGASCTV